jgi:Ring finger domain
MFFFHHAPELVRIILSASSVTARILSLAVLLLSLAPLGSIYVLFFSIGLGTGGGNYSHSDSSSQSGDDLGTTGSSSSYEDSLAAVLKNPNATLEDLWTAIFDSQMMFPQNLQAKAVLAALNHNDLVWLPVSAQSMHHLRILLPWILSFILGVLIPCTVSIRTILRRQRARHGGPRESNPAREKKILGLIAKSLAPYTKVLDASDRVDSETTIAQGALPPSDESLPISLWRVPEPGQSTTHDASSPTAAHRTISGLCGICLDLFAETQSVSWSSNPSCRHCFHDTCIQAWLLRTHRSRNAKQCPCCRQHFLLVKRSKL